MSRLIQILNRQHAQPVDKILLTKITRDLLEDCLDVSAYELGIHLVEAVEMALVNQQFLNHKGSTDVITFNHLESDESATIHGELFISVDDAMKQAKEFRSTWQDELVRYVVHGVLHLCGYDDGFPRHAA